jgi:hypothetical protein
MSFNICRGTLGSLAMFHAGENREGYEQQSPAWIGGHGTEP